MKLLGRRRTERAEHRDDAEAAVCERCGELHERLRDPGGRWFVCTRCGHRTDRTEEP